MPCAIGVDLGGTNLRVALVNHQGEVLVRRRQPTEAAKGQDHVVSSLKGLISELLDEAQKQGLTVLGIAAGIPGIVEEGVVHQSPHFPDWNHFNIREVLEKKFSVPIKVDNDANFVACGEFWLGAAKGMENFILLTFGTGIGGGVFVKGQPWRGDSGFAGEMGHMVIEAFGPPCGCGSRGCWELYCSSTGLQRLIEVSEDEQGRKDFEKWLGRDLSRLKMEQLYQAASEGNIFANTMFKKFGYYLGVGIASITNIFDIETFVIGGGVSQAWNFFIEEARKSLAKRTYSETAKRIKLVQAELVDDAGVLGAAGSFLVVR